MVDGERIAFESVNDALRDVFNNVSWIEEASLHGSDFKDISLKEMHIIAAISMYEKARASEVARTVHLTPSAMSSAIDKLVQKGYVQRRRSEADRRVVKLALTHRGRVVYRAHAAFHRNMTHWLIDSLSDHDAQVVEAAIMHLQDYVQNLNQSIK
ncbi:MarR family winged helix-turn-helix transcriptional regulator [Weissella halotolerans]|uniref:Transcriptional regulator, MarR family protein n=1 Tax=Weissella halotolerans DSM 20190 TaxID=1123500 RepID=A0A0R2FXX7_9LACO|nr:MarR family transcriptional regulator [Weissella halotolerans]KRN33257.1 transcriptional regulator, MarR family protein [Weissella halotolerans DSM 20190]